MSRLSWKEVRDQVQSWILDGSYGPGDKLPRDEDIADMLGCARGTVQRAMRDLADAGMVLRRRKGGTEVPLDPVVRAKLDIPLTRLEIEERGAAYGYQLVSAGLEETPRSVAARLGLSGPARLMHIRSLHLADGRPHIFEDRWVNPETVPEILTLDLAHQNANEWLVRHKPFTRCDIRLSARAASAEDADLLEIDPGAALFVTERTTWNGEAPITMVSAVAGPGYQLIAQS